MGWSDILGAVGGVAGAAGGLVGGPAGQVLSGIGTLANLGGQIGASATAAGQAKQASDLTGQASQAALGLAQEQNARESQAFSKGMGLVPTQTKAYQDTVSGLGPMPQVSADTVERRASQLLPEYLTDADRQMERMFSADMGNLMKAGGDLSTFGLQERAMLGSTSADLHRTAYNKAYQDALDYVKGIASGAIDTRKEALAEATDPYASAINAYLNFYGKSGGADQSLGTALTGASDLSRQAALGTQAAATGASVSNATDSLKDMWSGLKDIWGNDIAASSSSTDTSWLPGGTQMYGGTATQ